MVKSRLLGKSTLSSTIIGVIPQEPGEEVSRELRINWIQCSTLQTLFYFINMQVILGIGMYACNMQDDDFTAMHPIGTAAVVVQVTGTNWPQPAFTLLVTGLCRFKIDTLIQETPYAIARVTQLDKLPGEEAGM